MATGIGANAARFMLTATVDAKKIVGTSAFPDNYTALAPVISEFDSDRLAALPVEPEMEAAQCHIDGLLRRMLGKLPGKSCKKMQ